MLAACHILFAMGLDFMLLVFLVLTEEANTRKHVGVPIILVIYLFNN